MKLALVLVIAAALLPARAAFGEGDDTLTGENLTSYVDSVVKAYGGAKRVAKLKRHRLEGEVVALVRGGTASFRRDFVGPDSLRVELTYAHRSEVRILAGDKGWRGDAAEQRAVSGMPHTAMIYQMLRSSAPWFVLEYGDKLEHVTDEKQDGALHRVLRLKWSDDLSVDYWVDDATRRIAKVQGTLAAGGQSMTFTTEYASFKKVRGLLIPHTEKSFVGDKLTATATIQKVKLGGKKLGPFRPAKRDKPAD